MSFFAIGAALSAAAAVRSAQASKGLSCGSGQLAMLDGREIPQGWLPPNLSKPPEAQTIKHAKYGWELPAYDWKFPEPK